MPCLPLFLTFYFNHPLSLKHTHLLLPKHPIPIKNTHILTLSLTQTHILTHTLTSLVFARKPKHIFPSLKDINVFPRVSLLCNHFSSHKQFWQILNLESELTAFFSFSPLERYFDNNKKREIQLDKGFYTF